MLLQITPPVLKTLTYFFLFHIMLHNLLLTSLNHSTTSKIFVSLQVRKVKAEMMGHFFLVFEEKLSLSTEVYEDTQLWLNLMTKTSVKLIFLSQLKLSMVNLNIKSCNEKHVSIYLASKNGNFGSKDSCRNPNSVLLVGWKQEVLIRKRKGQLHELKKEKKSFLWVFTR